jgi:hypothetical protein
LRGYIKAELDAEGAAGAFAVQQMQQELEQRDTALADAASVGWCSWTLSNPRSKHQDLSA